MAKTIILSKLIEKLQTLLDEEGDLKVLFAVKDVDEDTIYGTIDPNPIYDGDVDIDIEQNLLVLYSNDTLADPDELLSNSTPRTRSSRSILDDYSEESENDWDDTDDDDWAYDDEDDEE